VLALCACSNHTNHAWHARLRVSLTQFLCMSVHFVSCTPSNGAAWSLLVGCIICSKQHCCWPCSCTMLLGSILTPNSSVLCICRFCCLYILLHILWPVFSVILWPEVVLCSITFWWPSWSDISSTKRWGTQWFSPSWQSFVPSTTPSMTEQ